MFSLETSHRFPIILNHLTIGTVGAKIGNRSLGRLCINGNEHKKYMVQLNHGSQGPLFYGGWVEGEGDVFMIGEDEDFGRGSLFGRGESHVQSAKVPSASNRIGIGISGSWESKRELSLGKLSLLWSKRERIF
jgi:hypothetical protein